MELAQASVGMTRAEANELVLELLSKYQDHLADAPQGKRYQDCYDVATGEPGREYQDLFAEVMGELASMGLNLDR